MDEQTESAPAFNERNRPDADPNETTAHQVLLAEARTTTGQQLGQVKKLDAAAIRTVRITFVLLGLLAGGSQLSPFPKLGVYGLIGTWSLLGTLFSCLFVYGTTHIFIGSSLEELSIDDGADSMTAHRQLIDEYENGMRINRKILYLNGFVLAIARSLLALSVVFVVLGLFRRAAEPQSTVSVVQTFIS